MTKARTNASASPAVGRNMIINGAMNVSQRATTTGTGGVGGTTAHYPTLDRWKILAGSTAGRATMSQTADGPNGISANCLKLDCTTADTSIASAEYFIIEYNLEGQNLQRIGKGVAGAKQVTVSFYVKASASFTFALEVHQSQHGRSCNKLFDVTTDWNRIELTFPADVDDGSSPIVDDNAVGIKLFFWLHAGATWTSGTLQSGSFVNSVSANRAAGIDSFFSNVANNFFITGVQMEVGPVATEFEQEDFGTTLAKCQRYCVNLSPEDSNPYILDGASQSSTIVVAILELPVEMRTTPTVTLSGTASNYTTYEGGTARAVTAFAANGLSPKSGGINFTVSSGLTVGRAAGVYINAGQIASIIEAEL